jgi:hypothetical protein
MPLGPLVVDVAARVGVRPEGIGDAEGLAVDSRAGVPGGGGFLAVVDIVLW